MAATTKLIDGDQIVTGEFWIVVATETRVIDHQTPEALTTVYRSVFDTEADACAEAVRLAGQFKGYAFAVLKSQAIAKWRCEVSNCSEIAALCRRPCSKTGLVRWQECEPEARRRLPESSNG